MKVRWQGETPDAIAARAELRRLALGGLAWSAIGARFGISEGAAHAAFRTYAEPGERDARQRVIDRAARAAASAARLAEARSRRWPEARKPPRRPAPAAASSDGGSGDPFAGLGECFR